MENDEQLKELGVKHFSEIFKDDDKSNIVDHLKVIQLFPSYVSSEEAEIFSTEVTLGEVEGDLKSFKMDKSHGPDGLAVEFFLSFFDLVGGDLLAVVESSIISGKVISSLDSSSQRHQARKPSFSITIHTGH